jgi:hypothetical protein
VAVLGDLSEAEVAILADPDGEEGQVEEIVARALADFVESEEAPAEETEDEVATEEAIEEDIAEEAREAEEVDGETLGEDQEVVEEAEQA